MPKGKNLHCNVITTFSGGYAGSVSEVHPLSSTADFRYSRKLNSPSTDWARKVYKQVDMVSSNVTDAEWECGLACKIDPYPCYGFLFEFPTCFLTAPNIDTDFVNHTSTLTWNYRIGNEGLIINFNTEVSCLL